MVVTEKRRRPGPRCVKVHFRELSYGERVRILPRGSFLQSAWPELVDAAARNGVAQ